MEADFHEIQRAQLVHEGGTGNYDENHILETPTLWANCQLQHFVLRSENKSVATVSMAPVRGAKLSIGLTFVTVALDSQGVGYGRHLLAAAEQLIKYRGNQKICVNATPSAANFYEACGFKKETWHPETLATWRRSEGDPPEQLVKNLLE